MWPSCVAIRHKVKYNAFKALNITSSRWGLGPCGSECGGVGVRVGHSLCLFSLSSFFDLFLFSVFWGLLGCFLSVAWRWIVALFFVFFFFFQLVFPLEKRALLSSHVLFTFCFLLLSGASCALDTDMLLRHAVLRGASRTAAPGIVTVLPQSGRMAQRGVSSCGHPGLLPSKRAPSSCPVHVDGTARQAMAR